LPALGPFRGVVRGQPNRLEWALAEKAGDPVSQHVKGVDEEVATSHRRIAHAEGPKCLRGDLLAVLVGQRRYDLEMLLEHGDERLLDQMPHDNLRCVVTARRLPPAAPSAQVQPASRHRYVGAGLSGHVHVASAVVG